MHGVKIKVNIVANIKPPAMTLESCVHHCVDGAPKVTSCLIRSILTAKTIGNNPRIVVIDVNNTGRNL